jgi:hypothetical protein
MRYRFQIAACSSPRWRTDEPDNYGTYDISRELERLVLPAESLLAA